MCGIRRSKSVSNRSAGPSFAGTTPRSLGAIDAELQGFAFEGAAMALTLLDHFMPVNRGRFHRFLHGEGAPHFYMLHVGAGWAMARLPWLGWRGGSLFIYSPP